MITVVLGKHTRGIIHGLYYTGNKLWMEYIIYKIYCIETILEKDYIREYVIESITLYYILDLGFSVNTLKVLFSLLNGKLLYLETGPSPSSVKRKAHRELLLSPCPQKEHSHLSQHQEYHSPRLRGDVCPWAGAAQCVASFYSLCFTIATCRVLGRPDWPSQFLPTPVWGEAGRLSWGGWLNQALGDFVVGDTG